MISAPRPPENRRRWVWAALLAGLVIALLPWWRNHDYLRDFYDYGLVIAAVGRIDQGELPYVDFATPIQAGYLGLSWLVERIGGGTYLALTRGGAALIAVMTLGLGLMLSRRWPVWAAVPLAVLVTCASATQHTIAWHNTLGVFGLALVAWSTALAPVLRRSDWTWHAVTALGLFLGGLNKLNFQLVALAVLAAWALRAALKGESGWGRVLATLAAGIGVGVAVPLAIELAWTGASWEVWRHNVVALAVQSRADAMRHVFAWEFLVRPIHDYYGPLALPQAGLAGLVLTLGILARAWPTTAPTPRARRWDWALLPLATLLSGAAGAAFLATNQEIVYVGLAAWLVLATSVWLGFAAAPRPWALGVALLLPASIIGSVAWVSAWRGERSQFGHSVAQRASYRLADDAGPTFAYLAGTRLPPEIVDTLDLFDHWLPESNADGVRPVFYAAGTEWLQRFLPGLKEQGQPLWVHWDTTYGPHEVWKLVQTLGTDLRYQVLFSTLSRDVWVPEVRPTLERYFAKDLLGPVTRRWTRVNHNTVYVADAIQFANQDNGNVASLALRTESQFPFVSLPFDGDRVILGVMGGVGRLLVSEPSYRFGADAVLERSSRAGPGDLHADFNAIVHGAVPEITLWSARITVPAGQGKIVVPFNVDARGKNVLLQVVVPPEQVGQIRAGYRNFQINHAIESSEGAPRLRPGAPADAPATPDFVSGLLGRLAWRPQQLVVRGGTPAPDGIDLVAGGELWLHTPAMTGDIRGRLISLAADGSRPMVRVVWYKGGRLQLMQQGQIPADRPFDFHVWTAEPGGWIGILVDPGAAGPAVQVRVDVCTLTP